MEIVTTRQQLNRVLLQKQGIVGFVPTMGALHRGHLSLMESARRQSDTVVVSIFVNPTQFNDPADLEKYPRTPEKDIELARLAQVDVVFMPAPGEIYPEPDARIFDLGTVAGEMEGATRPGHFNGVAQVVSRLFDLVKPDKAFFGEKDFQQVAVIRRMLEVTGQKVEIVVCPTVREDDGLAMSSRNALLTPECRKAAPQIYLSLLKAKELAAAGQMTPAEIERDATGFINSNPNLEVIYFNIVDPASMRRMESWNEKCTPQACVAVKAGQVRLIDNITLGKK